MCTTPPVIVPAKVQQRQSLLKCVTAQIQGAFLSGVVTRWEGISRFEIIFVVWKINPKWKRILLNNSRKGNGWGSLQWAINEIFFFLLPLLPAFLHTHPPVTGFHRQVFHWWTCSINLPTRQPPSLKPEPQPTTVSPFLRAVGFFFVWQWCQIFARFCYVKYFWKMFQKFKISKRYEY